MPLAFPEQLRQASILLAVMVPFSALLFVIGDWWAL